MRSIDVHAHVAPAKAIHLEEGQDWHGFTKKTESGRQFLMWDSKRYGLHPSYFLTPEQRLAQMDAFGVDIHVLSTWTQLYNYDLPLEAAIATSRDCNDYVAELVKGWPQRFAGLATLPMQSVDSAIAELERSMVELGLKGAMINDHVNGHNYDEPQFLPFWQAAEQMGALIMFHQVENDTIVSSLTDSYGLGNSIGNLADRTISFASLVFGGVMDKCPGLKVCLCHCGGYCCFGAGRLDRGWQVRSEARANILQPPSKYLNKFYYDCLASSEEALRFVIDTVGVDRVFLGSDWPYDPGFESPVVWINSLESLTQEEKEAILWKNLESLLGI